MKTPVLDEMAATGLRPDRFYDTEKDPAESVALSEENPDVVKSLESDLRVWQESVLQSCKAAKLQSCKAIGDTLTRRKFPKPLSFRDRGPDVVSTRKEPVRTT